MRDAGHSLIFWVGQMWALVGKLHQDHSLGEIPHRRNSAGPLVVASTDSRFACSVLWWLVHEHLVVKALSASERKFQRPRRSDAVVPSHLILRTNSSQGTFSSTLFSVVDLTSTNNVADSYTTTPRLARRSVLKLPPAQTPEVRLCPLR